MKKSTGYVVGLIVYSFALSGCNPGEEGLLGWVTVGDPSESRVYVKAECPVQTKGTMSVDDSYVGDINVYAYKDGLLQGEAYSSGDIAVLSLLSDQSYTIYALANAGEVHGPAKESDLGSLAISTARFAMCLREGRTFTFSPGETSVSIPLTRLFSRYNLCLDSSLQKCNFEIREVSVMQQASSISPFCGASAATSVEPGDRASSTDISSLNSGATASFYIPENCQGVLLPTNTDPWAKVPDNIPSKAGLCTYLHIAGKWTTAGASADLSVNLYLGADSCKDFNVVRNTDVTIVLSMEDSGTLRSSWKASLSSVEDNRILEFSSSTATIYQEDGWTELPLNISPSNMTFYSSMSGEGASKMETKVEAGKVFVRSLYEGLEKFDATLQVESWDSMQSSSIELSLDYIMGAVNYQAHIPQYYGEWGYIRVPDASAQKPVTISSGMYDIVLPQSDNRYRYYYDYNAGVEYHVFNESKTIYIHPVVKGACGMIDLSQYKKFSQTFMLPADYPSLTMEKGRVTESGNLHYDPSLPLYYDDIVCCYFSDEDGRKVDIGSFLVPDEVLTAQGLGLTDDNRFSSFIEMYGGLPTLSNTGSSNYVSTDVELATNRYARLKNESIFSKMYLFGMKAKTASMPQCSITATMSLSNGDELSGTGIIEYDYAFPSQRHLGEYVNYQLASGSLASNTLSIDFTGGGLYHAPTSSGVSWEVVHVNEDYIGNTFNAYDDRYASETYSAGASFDGEKLSFSEMSSTVFPSCGELCLHGSVKNPHSGYTFNGYYTLDLLLYLPIGCQVDFAAQNSVLAYSYVPFSQYSRSEFYSKWNSCLLPISISSTYDLMTYQVKLPTSFSQNAVKISGFGYASTYQSVMSLLEGHDDMFEFYFALDGNVYEALDLNRATMMNSSSLRAYANGEMGYYRLVPQYEMGCGLENHIIEAAYGSITDY